MKAKLSARTTQLQKPKSVSSALSVLSEPDRQALYGAPSTLILETQQQNFVKGDVKDRTKILKLASQAIRANCEDAEERKEAAPILPPQAFQEVQFVPQRTVSSSGSESSTREADNVGQSDFEERSSPTIGKFCLFDTRERAPSLQFNSIRSSLCESPDVKKRRMVRLNTQDIRVVREPSASAIRHTRTLVPAMLNKHQSTVVASSNVAPQLSALISLGSVGSASQQNKTANFGSEHSSDFVVDDRTSLSSQTMKLRLMSAKSSTAVTNVVSEDLGLQTESIRLISNIRKSVDIVDQNAYEAACRSKVSQFSPQQKDRATLQVEKSELTFYGQPDQSSEVSSDTDPCESTPQSTQKSETYQPPKAISSLADLMAAIGQNSGSRTGDESITINGTEYTLTRQFFEQLPQAPQQPQQVATLSQQTFSSKLQKIVTAKDSLVDFEFGQKTTAPLFSLKGSKQTVSSTDTPQFERWQSGEHPLASYATIAVQTDITLPGLHSKFAPGTDMILLDPSSKSSSANTFSQGTQVEQTPVLCDEKALPVKKASFQEDDQTFSTQIQRRYTQDLDRKSSPTRIKKQFSCTSREKSVIQKVSTDQFFDKNSFMDDPQMAQLFNAQLASSQWSSSWKLSKSSGQNSYQVQNASVAEGLLGSKSDSRRRLIDQINADRGVIRPTQTKKTDADGPFQLSQSKETPKEEMDSFEAAFYAENDGDSSQKSALGDQQVHDQKDFKKETQAQNKNDLDSFELAFNMNDIDQLPPPVPKGAEQNPFALTISPDEMNQETPPVPAGAKANPFAVNYSETPNKYHTDKQNGLFSLTPLQSDRRNEFQINLKPVQTVASSIPPVMPKVQLSPFLTLALDSQKVSSDSNIQIPIGSPPESNMTDHSSGSSSTRRCKTAGVTFAPQIEIQSFQLEKQPNSKAKIPKSCLRANSFSNRSSPAQSPNNCQSGENTQNIFSSKTCSTPGKDIPKPKNKDQKSKGRLQKSKSMPNSIEEIANPIKFSPPQQAEKVLQTIKEESDFGSASDETYSGQSSLAYRKLDTTMISDEEKNQFYAFGKGMLRTQSIDVSYVPKNNSLFKRKVKSTTGNPTIDFVVKQASGFGLDPDIFLRNSAQSPNSRLSSLGSSESYPSSQTPPEVLEVASLVSQSKEKSLSLGCQVKHQSFEPITSRLLSSATKSHKFNEKSKVPNKLEHDLNEIGQIDSSLLEQMIKDNSWLREETVKNRLQFSILSYYLKRQKFEEEKKIETLNNTIKVLKSHELKLNEITMRQQSKQQKLHFAFCFASPLVISGQNAQKSIYKLMPPLNFQKEFLKIQHSVEEAKVKLRMTKRQCTTNILSEILAKNPYGIHFSGHGLLNNEKELGPELHRIYKGQGNFLLLESEDGSGNLVSTETLTQMISKNYVRDSLQLVVVATCHSEFVGEIFQEAGAKHVICIHQQYEVEDDAVITFTDSFYGLLFDQKEICDAFEQAKLQVLLTHSEQQANIFKLLKYEDSASYLATKNLITISQKKSSYYSYNAGSETLSSKGLSQKSRNQHSRVSKPKHFCCIFGPFEKGSMQIWDPVSPQLRCTAPLQPTLIGRAVDKFKLIQIILNNKSSRLFTLTGMPGVGKSSLVLSTLEWLGERSLLRGGAIYFNARDIHCSMAFTRKICNQLMTDNPQLDQTFLPNIDCNKAPLQALKSIIAKLSRIEDNILLVIDNSEDLILNDKKNFRKLVSYFLQRVNSMKVLLTSRVLLYVADDFKEETIFLNGLNNKQAAGLFMANTRRIDQDERNRLMAIVPDFERFPNERYQPKPRQIHEHHLFTLLNGNPQSIILTAPVLSDQERCIDLPELYRVLTSDKICNLLHGAQIENRMLTSLRISAQVSVQHIFDTNCESLDLFFLLGLLPGGILAADLNAIWVKVMAQLRIGETIATDNRSMASTKAPKDLQVIKSCLQTAYNELLHGKIIEVDSPTSESNDADSNPLEVKSQQLIKMPEFIRSISEGLIDQLRFSTLDQIIVHWLYKIAKRQYCAIGNKQADIQALSETEEASFDKNFIAFVIRMLQNTQPDSQRNQGQNSNIEHSVLIESREKAFDDKSNESDTEEDNEGEASCQNSFLDRQLTLLQQRNSGTGGPPNQSALRQRKYSVASVLSRKRRKTIELQEDINDWDELHEAHQKTTAKHAEITEIANQNTFTKVSQLINLIENQINQPAGKYVSGDPDEQARHRWQQLLFLAKRKVDMTENMALSGLQTIGGREIEQEEHEHAQEGEMSPSVLRISKLHSSFSPTREFNEASSRSSGRQKKSLMLNFITAFKHQFKDTFDFLDQARMIQIPRGSIRKALIVSPSAQKKSIVGQSTFTDLTNMTFLTCDVASKRHVDKLNLDESIILFTLAAKMAISDHRYVLQLISKHLIFMHKTSKVFQGNVRRFQAYCLLQELDKDTSLFCDQDDSEKQEKRTCKELQIEDCLLRAIDSFEATNCAWGEALSHFQFALFSSHKIRHLRQSMQTLEAASKKKPSEIRDRFSKNKKQFNSSEVTRAVESSQLKEELEMLLSEFFEVAGKSILKFESLNHWKGLVQAYKLVDEVVSQCALSAQQLENFSVIVTEMVNSDDEREDLFTDCRGKAAKFTGQLRQSLFNETKLTKMINIKRELGDVFSLVTEIVHSANVKQIFRKKEFQALPTHMNSFLSMNQPEIKREWERRLSGKHHPNSKAKSSTHIFERMAAQGVSFKRIPQLNNAVFVDNREQLQQVSEEGSGTKQPQSDDGVSSEENDDFANSSSDESNYSFAAAVSLVGQGHHYLKPSPSASSVIKRERVQSEDNTLSPPKH